jgi:hypothetical protein
MLNRISDIAWFSAAGSQEGRAEAEQAVKEVGNYFQTGDLQVVWMNKDKLASLDQELYLGSSPLWAKLSDLPGKIRVQAEASGRESVIAEVRDNVTEKVFHDAFRGAFNAFEAQGQQAVQLAVGAALYVSVLGSLWDQFKDASGWETNPYGMLLKVFETGHWPVGMSGNQVYMI